MTKTLKLVVLFCIMHPIFTIYAQGYFNNIQFGNLKPFYNPAFTGYEHKLEVDLVSNIPVYTGSHYFNNVLSANLRTKKVHGAIGIQYMDQYIKSRDNYWNYLIYNNYQRAKISYAYQWTLSDSSVISFGGAAGVNYSVDRSFYVNGKRTTSSFTADLGISYVNKRLELGVGMRQIPQLNKSYYSESATMEFNAGYRLGKVGKFEVKPEFMLSALIKNVVIGQLSVMATYKSKWSFGGTYTDFSGNRNIALTAGATFYQRIKLGYSFQFSRFLAIGDNTDYPVHEIFIGYYLK